jgi:cysteine synthase
MTSILDCIGRTPLVPLGHLAVDMPVPVLAKCQHLNPGGSVKDRIALAIVDDAEQRGLLAPGATLVEATAGNTGVGLALVAAVRGYGLVCVMPEKMSHDKRVALAALGAQIIMTPNAPPADPQNFQNVARRLAKEQIRRGAAHLCGRKPHRLGQARTIREPLDRSVHGCRNRREVPGRPCRA